MSRRFRGILGDCPLCAEQGEDNLRSSLGTERPTIDVIVMMVDLVVGLALYNVIVK